MANKASKKPTVAKSTIEKMSIRLQFLMGKISKEEADNKIEELESQLQSDRKARNLPIMPSSVFSTEKEKGLQGCRTILTAPLYGVIQTAVDAIQTLESLVADSIAAYPAGEKETAILNLNFQQAILKLENMETIVSKKPNKEGERELREAVTEIAAMFKTSKITQTRLSKSPNWDWKSSHGHLAQLEAQEKELKAQYEEVKSAIVKSKSKTYEGLRVAGETVCSALYYTMWLLKPAIASHRDAVKKLEKIIEAGGGKTTTKKSKTSLVVSDAVVEGDWSPILEFESRVPCTHTIIDIPLSAIEAAFEGDFLQFMEITKPVEVSDEQLREDIVNGRFALCKPPVQREAPYLNGVSLKALIESILTHKMNGTINTISDGELNEDGNRLIYVTDGQRRIITAVGFIRNKVGLPLPCGIGAIDSLATGLDVLYFQNLPKDVQEHVLNSCLTFLVTNLSRLSLSKIESLTTRQFMYCNDLGTDVSPQTKVRHMLGDNYNRIMKVLDNLAAVAKRKTLPENLLVPVVGNFLTAMHRPFFGNGNMHLTVSELMGQPDNFLSPEWEGDVNVQLPDISNYLTDIVEVYNWIGGEQTKITSIFATKAVAADKSLKVDYNFNALNALLYFLFIHDEGGQWTGVRPIVELDDTLAEAIDVIEGWGASNLSEVDRRAAIESVVRMSVENHSFEEVHSMYLSTLGKSPVIGLLDEPTKEMEIRDIVDTILEILPKFDSKSSTNTKAYLYARVFVLTLLVDFYLTNPAPKMQPDLF